ncbi:hypothetical protein GCM10022240_14730 [Microbacterium kribbense]|uniref:HNH nuclease domain-containing protein n=1 Tax=Microbacterium kribbense TaxID=433645 RepID=A0ABP7GGS3_9MICO
MAIFTDIEAHAAMLRGVVGADVEAGGLPTLVAGLSDDQVVSLLTQTAALIRAAETVQVVATGVAASRSTRHAGQSGLAQQHGKNSATSLLQDLTGSTRSDAIKQVRAGEALFAGLAGGGETDDAAGSDGDSGGGGDADGTGTVPGDTCPPRPWHAPLGEALLAGRLSAAQHDAILRGLGEPPTIDAAAILAGAASETDGDAADSDDADAAPGQDGDAASGADGDAAPGDDLDAAAPDVIDALVSAARAQARLAWQIAAAQLVDEAQCRTVEDLAAQARAIRDLLDPEGAQRRFEQRYQQRAFRTWKDKDGIRHTHITHDDDGAQWVQAILDAALAPRRGVRFVDDAEKSRAQQLIDDPRTTEQLAYDLFLDLLRAGALADAETVFGTRQAGIRVIITQQAAAAADRGEPAVATVQDDTTTLPAWAATQRACDTGVSECLTDAAGNPLDLGREARLFAPKQKLTLAIRDGGCRWPACDRPAHYCEAHHIDGWATGGRTDIDRGILLCRFHHMQLHHGGWRITRHRKDDFVLHPPGGAEPIVLTTRLARQYLFRTTPPPAPRFHPEPQGVPAA